MPCLVAGIAFFFPRLAMILLVIFSDWLGRAYETILWPVLGFIFMPYTTLGYAAAMHYNDRTVSGWWLVLVAAAVLLDLGVIGGGATQRRTVVVRER